MSELLETLQNDDPQTRKQAIEAAAKQPASPELLAALERLAANDPHEEIRAAALSTLDAPALRTLRSQRLLKITGTEQRFILKELEEWQKQGLIGDAQAQALRSRYRIIVKPAPVPAAQTVTPSQPTAATPPQAGTKPQDTPASPAAAEPRPEMREPRPSLAQTLLSETSIKTFLYLGAFFVIAAAAILAALVETLRLPILSLAAIGFGGTAIALKKRLPQPSFTLFIVFSFILPINASVFADLVRLEGQALSAYWTLVLLTSACIWAFATFFYNSRFFSIATLGAFLWAGWTAPGILDQHIDTENQLLGLQITNLVSLAGIFLLSRKKDWKFSIIAFWFGQVVNLLLGLTLGVFIIINLFGYNEASTVWLFIALTCLTASLYYAASHLLRPLAVFAWVSTAAFAPVLALALSATEFARNNISVFAVGWVFWATVMSALSEITSRIEHLGWMKDKIKAYPLPLGLAGTVIFPLGSLLGLAESNSWGFGLFTFSALVLTIFNLLRPRGWVWITALVQAIAAYYLLFGLPFMPDWSEYLLYKTTLLAILFALPDILLRVGWKEQLQWFLPVRILAGVIGLVSILGILTGKEQTQSAVCAILLSGTYWLYAIRFQMPRLGYLPALLLPVGLAYGFGAIAHTFEIRGGFAAISALALLYYAGGWLLESRRNLPEWSRTLRWSGLAITFGLGIAAMVGEHPLEGWLLGGLASLLMIESRRHPIIELAAPLFLVFGFSQVFAENNIQEIHYLLSGMTMLWLGVDYAYQHIIPARSMRPLTLAGGLILILLSGSEIFTNGWQEPSYAIVSLLLAVFLLAYAILHRQAQFGYAFSAFLALAALTAARIWLDNAWLWLLTPLALAYFVSGIFIKNNWGQTLRISGLLLASLIAVSAPFANQEGPGWFVAILTAAWLTETWLRKRPWAESGFYISGLLSFGMILNQYDLLTPAYFAMGASIFLLGFDLFFGFSIQRSPILALPVRILGGISAAMAVAACLSNGIEAGEVLVVFGLTVFFALYAPLRKQPLLGYVPAGLMVISVLFLFDWQGWNGWTWALTGLSLGYYLISLALGRSFTDWSQVLRFSGIGLGTLTSFGALSEGPSVAASIPIALAASLWAVEAFRRRNVWLGFPSNALYLMSYFTLLVSLEVSQAQFYSVGAALLGLLMHYLLMRAGSDKGAFVTGLVSQLVLLGTTYIQMVANEQLGYFAALFFQALAVLVYGLVVRSRSLVGVPIAMLVLGVTTIVLFILRGLSTVILIGCTGIVMILVATLAVVLRERLAQMGERLSGWKA